MRSAVLFGLVLALGVTTTGIGKDLAGVPALVSEVFGPYLGDRGAPATKAKEQALLPRGDGTATAEEMALAEQRLFDAIPLDVAPYFDLFLYVSKSREGTLSQKMFIFERDIDRIVHPVAVWLVSTGRERREKYFTTTPVGLFQLDDERMFERWWSKTWDAPMPHAVFFDLVVGSGKSGIAIHAAARKDIPKLGTRASGGCVRLHPDLARAFFFYAKERLQGYVPAFAYDTARGTTSRTGNVVRAEDGTLVLTDGLKVLIYIEDFDGGPEPLLAPLVAMADGAVGEHEPAALR